MAYVQPTYVSDEDNYYGSDFNQDVVDNIIALRVFASSDGTMENLSISKSAQYSSEIALGDKATDFSVNFGNGNRQFANLTGIADITLLTSDLTCGNFLLRLTGGLSWSLDSDAVLYAGGTSPTPSTDGEDLLAFYFTDADSKFRLVASQDFE